MKIIPTSTDVNYTQVTQLSGQDFVLAFRWNNREGAWYVDISDQDEVPISTGRKLTVDYPLITRCKDPRRPKGLLTAIDMSGQGIDPGRFDLGGRVQLVYLEPDEVAAL